MPDPILLSNVPAQASRPPRFHKHKPVQDSMERIHYRTNSHEHSTRVKRPTDGVRGGEPFLGAQKANTRQDETTRPTSLALVAQTCYSMRVITKLSSVQEEGSARQQAKQVREKRQTFCYIRLFIISNVYLRGDPESKDWRQMTMVVKVSRYPHV